MLFLLLRPHDVYKCIFTTLGRQEKNPKIWPWSKSASNIQKDHPGLGLFDPDRSTGNRSIGRANRSTGKQNVPRTRTTYSMFGAL